MKIKNYKLLISNINIILKKIIEKLLKLQQLIFALKLNTL